MRFFGYSDIVKRLRHNRFRKTPATHTCRAQAQALERTERHIDVHDGPKPKGRARGQATEVHRKGIDAHDGPRSRGRAQAQATERNERHISVHELQSRIR